VTDVQRGPRDGSEEAGTVVSDAPSDEVARVTEIGQPETVDRAEHPWATALGVVALVLVVFVGLVAVASDWGGAEEREEVTEVVLPAMSGRTSAQATEALEQLGLLVELRYEPNETIPIDTVVEQDPIAGARVEVGEQVVLVVSDGPAGVRVPDLGDVTGPEAVRLLSAFGLNGVIEDVYDEEVPQNRIVDTVPPEGSRVTLGAEVRVRVSQGPEPRTVPDLVGMNSAEAFAALGRADLEVGRVTRRVVSDGTPGEVISTDPAPGAQAPRGYPVAVVIVADPAERTAPDLVGFTRSNATRIAEAAGLTVTVRTEAVTAADRRVGRVIAQSPMANSPVDAGAAITITVAAVPPPTTTTTSTPGGSTTTTAADD
jgi:serine/threonine-protein kinase